MSGWGAHLERYLNGLGTVRNFAKNGATTSSLRADGLWDSLLQSCSPGNWVLIQFGHNDQKLPELAPNGGYADNLETMVAEVRARSATPVLCTSVERRYFQSGRIVPTHGAYPLAVRQLGDRLSVAVIDLTTFSSWLYEHCGVEGSRRLFTHFEPGESSNWPDGIADDTHFSEQGAQAVASYIARALRPLLGLDSDAPPLGPELMARQATNKPGGRPPEPPERSRAD
jgi:lysophospholipase L1-like esterase